MKTVFLFVLLLAQSKAFAFDLQLKGYVIPAQISVSYYENLMPIIGKVPEDRRVFFVKAVVEFCRPVNSLEFEVRAQEMGSGGYALQLVSQQLVMDCRGPKTAQELTFPLPMGVDKNGPFYNAQPITVENLGPVY